MLDLYRITAHRRFISTAIVALVLLALLIVRPGEPEPRLLSNWEPAPLTADSSAMPPPLAPVPPISGAFVPSGAPLPARVFDLSVAEGLYPNERDALAAEMQQTVQYVTERFGSSASAPFTTALIEDAGCALHGIAYTDVRRLQVFTCASIGRDRTVALMAHEIVHQLQHDRYGPRHLSADLILSEGMATWAAGRYWLGTHPDFRSYVRTQRESGPFYPLATHYVGLGSTGMNALYYQWASFVEFLLQTGTRDQFDQLYISGQGAPGSANYTAIYGKTLAELEQEWLAWLEQP